MKRIAICLTILLIGIFISTAAFARPTYVGDIDNPTLKEISNIRAMDMAFGVGNWNNLTFANAMTSGLLSGGPDFIYIDVSDCGTNATLKFMKFMNTNQTALEDWVKRGGSLFMNISRLNGSNLDLGFDVTLHNDCIETGHAIDPTHTIFHRPNGNAGTNWSDDICFSQEYVTGTNLTGLISGDDRIILGEKDYGLGHLIVGGMSLSEFHTPQPHADILLENILNYGADCAADPL